MFLKSIQFVCFYPSLSSARSSVRSSSDSTITSLRATCVPSQKRKVVSVHAFVYAVQGEDIILSEIFFFLYILTIFISNKLRERKERKPTSSYLRSASSAMCLASFNWISCSSIFSSSFRALFSMTFMPLKARERETLGVILLPKNHKTHYICVINYSICLTLHQNLLVSKHQTSILLLKWGFLAILCQRFWIYI